MLNGNIKVFNRLFLTWPHTRTLAWPLAKSATGGYTGVYTGVYMGVYTECEHAEWA